MDRPHPIRRVVAVAGERGGGWGGLAAGLSSVPNLLTAARLVLVPVLWTLALTGHAAAVGVGLALAFVTDVADGYAARKLGQTSAFGSKFDSVVDGILGPSALVWLLLLKPDVILENLALAAAWLVVTYASLAVGLIRFRRFANLHLQTARIACVAQYSFLVDAFVTPAYSPVLLYLAAGLGIVAWLESLALQLLCTGIGDHEVSLLHALERRRAAA